MHPMSESESAIDAYFDEIERLAQICIDRSLVPHEVVEQPPQNLREAIGRCLELRTQFLSESDERRLGAYFELGLFAERSPRERITAFAVAFELQHAMDVLAIERQCEDYDSSQELFAGAPSLFCKLRKKAEGGQPDYELIDATAVRPVAGSEIYKAENGYGKLTPYLNPGIVNWAREQFPAAALFIRLDPHFFSNQQPLQLLTEATFVPANPKGLPRFSLRKGMKEFAAYALQDAPASDGMAQYWDYHVKRIRRLEVRAERREDNYLTMMLEELPSPDQDNGLMIGRCIHLDTEDPVGTPLDKVMIKHLDLAINVYRGETRSKRYGQTL
jgi:hypothetical protein